MMHILMSLRTLGRLFDKNDTIKIAGGLIILWFVAMLNMAAFENWTLMQTTWWFIVTITTVGYGDISPSSFYGQFVAIIIILLGIGAGALLIGNVATSLITFRRKKMKGFGDYSNWKDHIVIMGWRGQKTEQILQQIFNDKNRKDRRIIICSASLEEIPDNLMDKVTFVRGPLSTNDVLHRAAVDSASRVIIYGKNDQETALTTLAVVAADDDDKAHITVYIEDAENVRHVENIGLYHGQISVVKSLSTDLIVQEMQDKGIAEIITKLVNNESGSTPYRIDLPVTKLWNTIQLGIPKHILLLAGITVKDKIVINPQDNPMVSTIFVIAQERPTKGEIQ